MKIIKSFRKSLSMKIDESWELIVKVPRFVSNKKIEEFIDKHRNWIEEKKQLVLSRIKNYSHGEKFYYFWEEYELIYSWDSKKIDFDWINFYLNIDCKKDAKILFEKFYKKKAKIYIKNRLDFISKKYDLKYNKFRITSAKTRWGSCSNHKNINFSYRLIMSPIIAIDYVIVHELAHLKEMNHSKNFRDLVKEMTLWLYPWDYKIHKKWLKEHGGKMVF